MNHWEDMEILFHTYNQLSVHFMGSLALLGAGVWLHLSKVNLYANFNKKTENLITILTGAFFALFPFLIVASIVRLAVSALIGSNVPLASMLYSPTYFMKISVNALKLAFVHRWPTSISADNLIDIMARLWLTPKLTIHTYLLIKYNRPGSNWRKCPSKILYTFLSPLILVVVVGCISQTRAMIGIVYLDMTVFSTWMAYRSANAYGWNPLTVGMMMSHVWSIFVCGTSALLLLTALSGMEEVGMPKITFALILLVIIQLAVCWMELGRRYGYIHPVEETPKKKKENIPTKAQKEKAQRLGKTRAKVIIDKNEKKDK